MNACTFLCQQRWPPHSTASTLQEHCVYKQHHMLLPLNSADYTHSSMAIKGSTLQKGGGTIPALNEGPPRGNRLPSIFYIYCCLTISTTLWGHHHGATHCRGHVVESHGITRPATISMDVVFRIIWVVYSMNRSPDSRISNWM